jgi:hypothetical protein
MRYPHLRSDPDNPVDVESTDDGIRFVGAGGASATISWDEIVGVWLQIQDTSHWPRPLSAILPNPNPLLSARAFTCELRFKSRRTLMIAHDSADTHLSAAYVDLIDDIHRHLLTTTERRRFRAGAPWSSFLYMAAASTSYIAINWWWLIPVMVMGGRRLGSNTWQVIALTWRNRPRQYRANKVPKAMLPEVHAPTSPAAGSPPP